MSPTLSPSLMLLIGSLIVSLGLLARCLFLKKQVEALVAAKLLEGQTVQKVPAWQIRGKTASRVIGLIFFSAACLLGLGVSWLIGPLDGDTLRVVKGVVGGIGAIATVLLTLVGFIGLFGGMD